MKATFILHDFRRCPFCIRTRMVLYLKDIPYEVVEEPLREWTDWMREWGGRTGERLRVPVLREINEYGKEIVHTESNQINLMLDALDGEKKYTPTAGSIEYKKMEEWFDWCDNTLKPLIDKYKYGTDGMFDPSTLPEHTAVLGAELSVLDAALAEQSYLLGSEMSLADIAIIPFVRQIMRTRGGEFDFTPYSNVSAWALNILESAWFETKVMRKKELKLD